MEVSNGYMLSQKTNLRIESTVPVIPDSTINLFGMDFEKMIGYEFSETDLKLDLSFGNINSIVSQNYEMVLPKLQNITLNKTVVNMTNFAVSAYLKIREVEYIT